MMIEPKPVVLKLNEYQASNLYWLLLMSISIDELHTGDWNNEVLYELGKKIFEHSIIRGTEDIPEPNGWTKELPSWKELVNSHHVQMIEDIYMHYLKGRCYTTENVANKFMDKYKI